MASTKPSFARKLSPIERLSLALNEYYHYDVVMFLEGFGELDVTDMRRAVAVAAQANPGCRVRLRGVLGFAKWVDSGIAPPVNCIDAPNWDGRSERGADFLERGFEPLRNGPVCDVLLVRGDQLRIVFRTVHGAIDGRGLQHWAEDVFRVLRGQQPLGSLCTLREIDIMRQFSGKVPQPDPYRSDDRLDISLFPVGQWRGQSPRYSWRCVRVGKNITHALPKMAVFLAEYARRGREGTVSFTVPIDLRSLRGGGVSSTGNLTGYVNLPVDPGDTAKSVMQRLSQRLRDHADCRIAPELARLPWVPFSILIKMIRQKIESTLYETVAGAPTGGLVSIGLIKLELYCCPSFTATKLVGIPGYVGKFNVVMINQADHMFVSFAVPESYNRAGELDRMTAEFVSHFDAVAPRRETMTS